jgi:uncharacterized membrane protein YphA (DoxX/SURF4 family)
VNIFNANNFYSGGLVLGEILLRVVGMQLDKLSVTKDIFDCSKNIPSRSCSQTILVSLFGLVACVMVVVGFKAKWSAIILVVLLSLKLHSPEKTNPTKRKISKTRPANWTYILRSFSSSFLVSLFGLVACVMVVVGFKAKWSAIILVVLLSLFS